MNLGMFVLGGIILIASGIIQLLVRPRPAEGRARGVDGAVVRTVMFVTFGLLAVLVGLGVVPLVKF